MRHIRNAAIALIAMSGAALIGSAASAQVRDDSPYRGSYYTYGAERANPSISPNGWDQDSPRDFQLQGGH